MSDVKIVRNRVGWAELMGHLAVGMHAVALDTETEAKREAPVRGGYRSFRPGEKPIGGTLRRSIHSVTYGVDGSTVGISREGAGAIAADETPVPGQITSFVGTNTGYGIFVELGTSKMPARAFLAPAADIALGRAPTTMEKAISRVRRRGV